MLYLNALYISHLRTVFHGFGGIGVSWDFAAYTLPTKTSPQNLSLNAEIDGTNDQAKRIFSISSLTLNSYLRVCMSGDKMPRPQNGRTLSINDINSRGNLWAKKGKGPEKVAQPKACYSLKRFLGERAPRPVRLSAQIRPFPCGLEIDWRIGPYRKGFMLVPRGLYCRMLRESVLPRTRDSNVRI